MMRRFIKKEQIGIFFLVVLIVFHLVGNITWLMLDDLEINFHPHFFYYKLLLVDTDCSLDIRGFLKEYIEPIERGLYLSLLSIICYFFGKSIFLINFISSLFFVVLIVLVFLSSEKVKQGSGIYSAFLFSFSPFVFGTSRMAEVHLPIMIGVILVYYYMVKIMSEEKKENVLALIIISGVFIANNPLQVGAFVLSITSPIIYLLVFSKVRVRKGILLLSFLFVVYFAVQKYFYFKVPTEFPTFGKMLQSYLIDPGNFYEGGQVWKNPFNLLYGFLNLYVAGSGSLYLFFFIFALLYTIKNENKQKLIVFVYCFAATYLLFLVPSKKSSYAFLYGIMPVVAIISGVTLLSIITRHNSNKIKRVLLVLMLILLSTFSFLQYMEKSFRVKLLFKSKMGDFIKQQQTRCFVDDALCYRGVYVFSGEFKDEILKKIETNRDLSIFFLVLANDTEEEIAYNVKEILLFLNNLKQDKRIESVSICWDRDVQIFDETIIIRQLGYYRHFLKQNESYLILLLSTKFVEKTIEPVLSFCRKESKKEIVEVSKDITAFYKLYVFKIF